MATRASQTTSSLTTRTETTAETNQETHGIIRLQGESSNPVRVTFSNDTIDNEHLNRKKSKICCIYKKPYDPNVSSDESDSDDVNDYERQPNYKKKHVCNH
jgi:protein phosphatase 1 regulatory subunit 11